MAKVGKKFGIKVLQLAFFCYISVFSAFKKSALIHLCNHFYIFKTIFTRHLGILKYLCKINKLIKTIVTKSKKMKKLTIFCALLFLSIGGIAQSSKNWSQLENKKLKLVKFCKGMLDDNEVVRTGQMQNGDWLEYFYLYDDGRFIWEKMDGTERYRTTYEGSTLDVEHGRGDLEWIQVNKRDDEKVVLWCSDGYIRYCRIVKHDEDFINLEGKMLKIDMTCQGETQNGHATRIGDIERATSDSYIYVKDSHRIDIIKNNETVAKYKGYIKSNSFNISETIFGSEKDFFQIIDRCEDKYTIYSSDGKIRYCRLVDDDDDDDDDDW